MRQFVLGALLLLSGVLGQAAETLKTTFNPFSGRLDFITEVSTQNFVPGSGVGITCTNGVCTITASGSAASALGLSKNGVQFSSPTAGIDVQGEGVAVGTSAGSVATLVWVSTTAFTTKNQTWTAPQTYSSSITMNSADLNLVQDSGTYIRAKTTRVTPAVVLQEYVDSSNNPAAFFGYYNYSTIVPFVLNGGLGIQDGTGGSVSSPSDVYRLEVGGGNRIVILKGGLALFTTGYAQFFDTGNANYVRFRSSDTIAHTQDYVFPASTSTVGSPLEIANIDSNGVVSLAWGTDDSGGGGADNLGSHVSTQTLVANFGIEASTGVFSSTVTAEAIEINGTGNFSFINEPDGLTYQVVGTSVVATPGHVAVFGASNTIIDGGALSSSGGGGGYAVEPATVTFNLAKGVLVSTIVINSSGTFTLRGNDPVNFLTLTMDNDHVRWRFFDNGVNDNQVVWFSTMMTVNTALTTEYITALGALRSGPAGTAIGLTNAGIVDLWSAGGNPTYVSFNESGIANRGVLGFGAGSDALVFQSGSETFGSGTERLRISPTTGIQTGLQLTVQSSGTFTQGLRASTGTFVTELTVAGQNVCLQDGTNCPTTSAALSPFFVATGTLSGFTTPASSPTAGLNLHSTQFKVTKTAGATAFIEVDPSTFTMLGSITATYPIQLSGSALSFNHTLTSTLTVNESQIIRSTGSTPSLRIVANGTYGTTPASSGGLHLDCTGGGAISGYCSTIYSNAGAQSALGGLLNIKADNTAFNEPLLYLVQDGTPGGAANIRMDGPAPQIEMVENDQSTPAGKYEFGVNGDIGYMAGRNAADNSFDIFFRMVRKDAAGGGYVAVLSSIPVRFYDADSSNYVAFGASATVASNVRWVWPDADGTAGQLLSTRGNGELVWATDQNTGGSGQSFSLAVATGSITSFTTPASSSSVRSILNLNADQFDATLQGEATSFISIKTGGIGATELASTAIQSGDIEAGDLPSDGYASTYVNVTGDTMTGQLTVQSSGTFTQGLRVTTATVTQAMTVAGQNVCLQDGTGCPAAGIGDMVLASTQTSTGGKVFKPWMSVVGSMTVTDSAGTNAMRVTAGGTAYGTDDETGGGFLVNCPATGLEGRCAQITTNAGAQPALSGVLSVIAENTAWDTVTMYVKAYGSDPENGVRIDGNDYATLQLRDTKHTVNHNGRYQFSTHNNQFRGERRMSDNSAYESVWVIDNSTNSKQGLMYIGTDYDTAASTFAVAGNLAVGASVAGGTAAPVNGLLVQGDIRNQALTASQLVATDADKDLVSGNAGNYAVTGTWDFGGGVLEVPNGTGPTVDATGEIAWDTTDGTLILYDGTAARVIADDLQCKTAVIGSSGTWDSQAIPIYQNHPDGAITLASVHAAVLGGTSITYNIEERAQASLGSAGTDIYASDQAADTNGEDETSFSNAGIAANAHLVFTTGASAATGDVGFISLRLCFRRDVE